MKVQVREDLINYVATEEVVKEDVIKDIKSEDFVKGVEYVLNELKTHFAIDNEELAKVDIDQVLEDLHFNRYAEKYQDKKELYKQCGERF